MKQRWRDRFSDLSAERRALIVLVALTMIVAIFIVLGYLTHGAFFTALGIMVFVVFCYYGILAIIRDLDGSEIG